MRIFARNRQAMFASAGYGRLGEHETPCTVLAYGRSAPIRIRLADGASIECEAAVLAPLVLHAIEAVRSDAQIAFVWPMASVTGFAEFVGCLTDAESHAGGRIAAGRVRDADLLEAVCEPKLAVRERLARLGTAIDRFCPVPRPLDPRVRTVLELIEESTDASQLSVREAAERVDLSPSRLQFVFTRDVGVPFRRYRAWIRLCNAIQQVDEGANLTEAAHEAGFADLAHFSNEYRRTFGEPASQVMVDPSVGRHI